jgi:hypothetical protein
MIHCLRRTNAGNVATEEFRARSFHVEVNGLQQIQFPAIEAINVPGVRIGGQESVKVGRVLIVLPASVCPGSQLEQRQAGYRCHASGETFLYFDPNR